MHTVEQIIISGANKLGVSLPPKAPAAFLEYFTFLEECGSKFNLTAISGAEDIARMHFLDSIALLNAESFSDARVIDIGSGAGFPGVPLKLAEPSVCLTMLDATAKRVDFLTELSAKLTLGAQCLYARAEDASRTTQMRDAFDIAVSRAVAKLSVLCELCLPFVRVGGKFLAMKSLDSSEELNQALPAISILGAAYEKSYEYEIPETGIFRTVLVIKKTQQTPQRYPRRFARIISSPLLKSTASTK